MDTFDGCKPRAPGQGMLVLQLFGSHAAREEGLRFQTLHTVAELCGDWLPVTARHTNMMIASTGRRMSLLYSYSL